MKDIHLIAASVKAPKTISISLIHRRTVDQFTSSLLKVVHLFVSDSEIIFWHKAMVVVDDIDR